MWKVTELSPHTKCFAARAVCRIFFPRRDKFGVWTKEVGGAEAYVGCYTLHLLGGGGGGGGGENDTRGIPPLKYSPGCILTMVLN